MRTTSRDRRQGRFEGSAMRGGHHGPRPGQNISMEGYFGYYRLGQKQVEEVGEHRRFGFPRSGAKMYPRTRSTLDVHQIRRRPQPSRRITHVSSVISLLRVVRQPQETLVMLRGRCYSRVASLVL